jgi:hypothetical protein
VYPNFEKSENKRQGIWVQSVLAIDGFGGIPQNN